MDESEVEPSTTFTKRVRAQVEEKGARVQAFGKSGVEKQYFDEGNRVEVHKARDSGRECLGLNTVCPPGLLASSEKEKISSTQSK